MNRSELMKLYPRGKFSSSPSDTSDLLSLATESGYFLLPKKDVTDKEIALLLALFPKDERTAIDRVWYRHLFQNQPLLRTDTFRILHMQIKDTTNFLRSEWLKNLQAIFPHSVELFFFSDTEALLIEAKAKDSLPFQEIQGIFVALDVDFSIQTSVFVGKFHGPEEDLPRMFQEERSIFETERSTIHTQEAVFSLPTVALHYYTQAVEDSLLIKSWTRDLQMDDEMQEIIHELWRNLGNISSTAKALYLHRNTLSYRIDRFQENYGLNLRDPNDLFFCYFLLLRQ